MRYLIAFLLMVVTTAQGQPLWRNFFTTNQNPRVTVAAGSNITVQASTAGVDQRIFTVNANLNPTNIPPLNYISSNAGFGTNTTFSGVLNASNATLTLSGVGTTISPIFVISNGAPSSLGAQQVSPGFMMYGHGWRSGNSTDMPVGMGMYVLPVQGSSANPGARLTIMQSVSNAAPASTGTYFADNGGLNTGGAIVSGSSISGSTIVSSGDIGVSGAYSLYWTGSRGAIYSPSNTRFVFTSSAFSSVGAALDNWIGLTIESVTNNPTLAFKTSGNTYYASTVHSNITAQGNIGVTATNFILHMPQWVDMIGTVLPGSGVAEPAPTAITNGSVIKAPGFQLTDEEHYAIQMPHNIAVTNATFVLGTNVNQWHIEPHIHFMPTGATIDATHSNVTWQIEWAVSEPNGDIKAQGTNTLTQGVTVNGRHYYKEFGPITNAGPWGVSAMFNARLTRQSSGSQELAPNGSTRDVVRLKFDLHVPVGNAVALGSRGESSQ